MKHRTPKQIVTQTNELARKLYALRGYKAREGYRFDRATRAREIEAWEGACEAQRMLTATDPMDAFSEIEEESE